MPSQASSQCPSIVSSFDGRSKMDCQGTSTESLAPHHHRQHPVVGFSASLTLSHKSLKRRGLSKHYSSKSQSFGSLDLALCTGMCQVAGLGLQA